MVFGLNGYSHRLNAVLVELIGGRWIASELSLSVLLSIHVNRTDAAIWWACASRLLPRVVLLVFG